MTQTERNNQKWLRNWEDCTTSHRIMTHLLQPLKNIFHLPVLCTMTWPCVWIKQWFIVTTGLKCFTDQFLILLSLVFPHQKWFHDMVYNIPKRDELQKRKSFGLANHYDKGQRTVAINFKKASRCNRTELDWALLSALVFLDKVNPFRLCFPLT